jgi:hypothetical protein
MNLPGRYKQLSGQETIQKLAKSTPRVMPAAVETRKFLPKRSYAVLSKPRDTSLLDSKCPLYEAGADAVPPIGYEVTSTGSIAEAKKDGNASKEVSSKSLSLFWRTTYFLFGLPLPDDEPFLASKQSMRIVLRSPPTLLPHSLIAIAILPLMNYAMSKPIFSSAYGVSPSYWLEASTMGFLATLVLTSSRYAAMIQTSPLLSKYGRNFNLAIVVSSFLLGVAFGGLWDVVVMFYLGLCIRVENSAPLIPPDDVKASLPDNADCLKAEVINAYIKDNLLSKNKKK